LIWSRYAKCLREYQADLIFVFETRLTLIEGIKESLLQSATNEDGIRDAIGKHAEEGNYLDEKAFDNYCQLGTCGCYSVWKHDEPDEHGSCSLHFK
jgi:hypothetical protein